LSTGFLTREKPPTKLLVSKNQTKKGCHLYPRHPVLPLVRASQWPVAGLKAAVTTESDSAWTRAKEALGSAPGVAIRAQLSSWRGEVVNELGRQLLAAPVVRLLRCQRDAEPVDDGPIVQQARGPTLEQELRNTLPVTLTDALPDLAPAVAFTAWLLARRGYSARDLSRRLTLTAEHSD
jgi:hypothetical protein